MKLLKIVFLFSCCLVLVIVSCTNTIQSKGNSSSLIQNESRPNVIFFAVDDMNDFINPLGYSQAKTPNLDRLAKMGVTFTNAHAPAPFCAPSRTAIWTGLQAYTTGCYTTQIYQYDYPSLVPMHESFKQAGYKTYGAGKLFHHRPGHLDMDGWDEYFARNDFVSKGGYNTGYHGEDLPLPSPYPYSPYFRKTDKKITGGKFLEWGPISPEDEPKMMGVKRTKWVCDLLSKRHQNPFFLGLGLYTPHFPNYAPQRYFDIYKLDEIEVPALPENDLDDLPPMIQKRMRNRSKIQETLEDIGAVKEAVRAYMAAISYADGLLGEVLDALEQSAYKDNTIIVFWSDHGYHLGEKGNWGKHTLWRETSGVPFFFAGPGILKEKVVQNTVGLIDIYPTLTELCGLPKQHKLDGQSIVNLLNSPNPIEDNRQLLVPSHERGSFSIISSDFRYISYAEGGEELYNLKEDSNEWKNLAGDPSYENILLEMRKQKPIFRASATPKDSLELVLENYTYHWIGKEGVQPQLIY